MNQSKTLFLKRLRCLTALVSISGQFDRYRRFRYIENAVVLVLTCNQKPTGSQFSLLHCTKRLMEKTKKKTIEQSGANWTDTRVPQNVFPVQTKVREKHFYYGLPKLVIIKTRL